MKQLTVALLTVCLLASGCSRKKTAEQTRPTPPDDNVTASDGSQESAHSAEAPSRKAGSAAPEPIEQPSEPEGPKGPPPPRLEEWAFTPRQASSVSLAFQHENILISPEHERLLALSKPPMGPLHLVHRKRLAGDFVARIRVRMPGRKDADVQHKGGTAIPYFGFRGLDGKRQYTAPAPQLIDEALEHELTIERVGAKFFFAVDGQPRKGSSGGSAEPGHVCLHLNGPAKVWVTGFDVNNDSTLLDFGVPRVTPIDISPNRWVCSSGGSDPTDVPNEGTLRIATEDGELVLEKNVMKGNDTIRHLETFEGDFHLRMELLLPTIEASGGYHTRSGVGANIEIAFRPTPSQTGGVRHSVHLSEATQTVSLAIRREGDLHHVLLDEKRVAGFRFPGSENPGHIYLSIGGVGGVRMRCMERVIGTQPLPGTSLAAASPAPIKTQPQPKAPQPKAPQPKAPQPKAPQPKAPTDSVTAEPQSVWRDLLKGLDLSGQTLRGRPRFNSSRLITDAMNVPSLVRTSFTAPRRYELRAVVTRLSGDGAFYLLAPISERPCAVIIEAENEGKLSSGLALIDRMAPKNPEYPGKAFTERLLPIGKRVEVRCKVDGDQFEMRIDDRHVFSWSEPARLTLTPFFQNRFPSYVMFGSARSSFQVHQLEMRPLESRISGVRAPLRIWLDNTGAHQLHARFVKLDDGSVHLETKDGREVIVPLERLKESDRNVAKRAAAAMKKK